MQQSRVRTLSVFVRLTARKGEAEGSTASTVIRDFAPSVMPSEPKLSDGIRLAGTVGSSASIGPADGLCKGCHPLLSAATSASQHDGRCTESLRIKDKHAEPCPSWENTADGTKKISPLQEEKDPIMGILQLHSYQHLHWKFPVVWEKTLNRGPLQPLILYVLARMKLCDMQPLTASGEIGAGHGIGLLL
ncbi:hypothetical protein BC826DRAFT_971384 [Russula brevipes]|nr:hypothetical protein BC826DRAFT_971384 [Russula brevipes]